MKETKQVAASPETRAAMHEMMAVFEAYKADNEQRLAEIAAGRAPDPLIEEKMARVEDALKAAEQRYSRAAADSRRPALAQTPVARPDERKGAFTAYMRSGQTSPLMLEAKSLSEGTPSAGGYVVSPEIERMIERRLAAASPMREIATVRTIGAGTYKKPVSTVGITAGWAAETGSRAETAAATLDLLDFPAADLYANPAATQALLDDAFVNIDEWLAEEVQDAFAAQETDAFVTGDGTNKPKGFLAYTTVADASQAWGQIGYIATGAAGAFPASDPADVLIDLIYAPKSQYRAGGRFVMNRRTASAVRKFKDSNGDYIWSPATQPGAASTLLGYPVTEIETMPDIAADAYAVAFGDFSRGYLIVDRAGVRVLRDPYSAKPYVLFYTTKRVGGGVQNFDAIKLLKFAAS
jgi:HK97 family phage major capsid protein